MILNCISLILSYIALILNYIILILSYINLILSYITVFFSKLQNLPRNLGDHCVVANRPPNSRLKIVINKLRNAKKQILISYADGNFLILICVIYQV